LVDKTLHEALTSKKTSLKHLRAFDYDAYVHVPMENRSRVDNNDLNCIFICYKDGIKVYKLWNPVTKKIVYSRNVVFREIKMVPKQEVQPMEEEPETTKFELEGEESNLTKEDEP
jgi:hypothetical protein